MCSSGATCLLADSCFTHYINEVKSDISRFTSGQDKLRLTDTDPLGGRFKKPLENELYKRWLSLQGIVFIIVYFSHTCTQIRSTEIVCFFSFRVRRGQASQAFSYFFKYYKRTDCTSTGSLK